MSRRAKVQVTGRCMPSGLKQPLRVNDRFRVMVSDPVAPGDSMLALHAAMRPEKNKLSFVAPMPQGVVGAASASASPGRGVGQAAGRAGRWRRPGNNSSRSSGTGGGGPETWSRPWRTNSSVSPRRQQKAKHPRPTSAVSDRPKSAAPSRTTQHGQHNQHGPRPQNSFDAAGENRPDKLRKNGSAPRRARTPPRSRRSPRKAPSSSSS